jgi:hypothetical protein
MRDFSF